MNTEVDAVATLSDAVKSEIEHWAKKFPADRRQSAVIGALHAIQDHQGYISDADMNAVAEYLGMPRIAVYEVATFYSMFELKPVGRHKICVCTSVSCLLNGSEKIVERLNERLGIGFGETTPDGLFTLKEVECLCACGTAPVAQIGHDYHENLTPDKIDAILTELEGGENA
jgi:NADH-quinone oxidoreductase subunit E